MDDAVKSIEVDGVRIAYDEVGAGEPIVMLHGYPQSRATWRHQVAALSTTHRVIAIDWPGWGDSERSLTTSTSYDDQVTRIGRVLDALAIPRCNLFVHDYGGFIGLGFLVAHPERVMRFAILNSRAHETFVRLRWWTTRIVGAMARRAPWLIERGPVAGIHELGLAPYVAAGCFDQDQVERYIGWMRARDGRRWYATFFASYPLGARRDLLVELARLHVPTAVIWGTSDPWCPLATGQELAATMPDATLTKIDGGLHFVMEHRPAEVTAALRTLLDRPAATLAPPIAPVPRQPPPPSPIERAALLAGWSWAVCAVLIVLGAVGLFTEKIGPLPTNQAHALALNLGVGIAGFGFARFEAERAFVLISGIGMIALAAAGFAPPTRPWLYETFHLTALSSWLELAGGVVSLVLWYLLRPPVAPSAAAAPRP